MITAAQQDFGLGRSKAQWRWWLHLSVSQYHSMCYWFVCMWTKKTICSWEPPWPPPKVSLENMVLTQVPTNKHLAYITIGCMDVTTNVQMTNVDLRCHLDCWIYLHKSRYGPNKLERKRRRIYLRSLVIVATLVFSSQLNPTSCVFFSGFEQCFL